MLVIALGAMLHALYGMSVMDPHAIYSLSRVYMCDEDNSQYPGVENREANVIKSKRKQIKC